MNSKKCPVCGMDLGNEYVKFCPACGSLIAEQTSASPSEEQSSDLPFEKQSSRQQFEQQQRNQQQYNRQQYNQQQYNQQQYNQQYNGPKGRDILSKTWLIVLACIIFPPAGIALLWIKNKPAQTSMRIAVTGVLVLYMLIGISSLGSENGDTASEVSKEQITEESTGKSAGKEDADGSQKSGSEAEKAENKPAAVLTGITASYSGNTEEGTVLDANNTGISVTATYDNGSTQDVSGWSIVTPVSLVAGQESTVQITYKEMTCELKVLCTTIDEGTYKAQCASIAYDDLARNPDTYMGNNIYIYGQVIQIQEDGNDIIMRVATKDSGYGLYYDDVVLISYSYKPNEGKVLENDMVTIYGIYAGTTTYETVMGSTVTIPGLYAEYVDVQ